MRIPKLFMHLHLNYFLLFGCIAQLMHYAFIEAKLRINIWPSAEQLQNRETGQNLIVTCAVQQNYSSVLKSINWYKSGQSTPILLDGRIVTSKIRPTTVRLMFTEPKLSDSNTYRCVVSTEHNQKFEESVQISFIEDIKFVDAPLQQHPVENADAQIKCFVHGHKSVEVYWQFNGKNIMEGWPRGYELRNNSQVLFIPKFKSEEDDGEYACRATQFFSFKIQKIQVQAYVAPQIEVFEGPHRLFEGKDFKLICQSTGKPKPAYRWLKNTDGVEIPIESSQKYIIEDGLLIVKSVMPYDQGVYSCLATNALDTTRRDLNFTVFRKPKIELMRNETKSRGDLVELRCLFSGDGNLTAKWIHQGEEWKAETFDGTKYSEAELEESRNFVRLDRNTAILTIFSLQDDDAGQYQCVVENEAGMDQQSTYLAIIHPPKLIDKSEDIYTIMGSRVEMFCKATAIPYPTWSWFDRHNVSVEADGSTHIINSTTMQTKLIINALAENDFGEYECSARNSIGFDHGKISLRRIYIPTVPTKFQCNSEHFPNYAICRLIDYAHTNRSHRPTLLSFIYHKIEVEPETNQQVKNFTVSYTNQTEIEIPNLETKSKYEIHIIASNEAGTSPSSRIQQIETSSAWVPEPPINVRYACLNQCRLSWSAPYDGGSSITAYKLLIREVKGHDLMQTMHTDGAFDVGADQMQFDLTFLKPSSLYELQLFAVNRIGSSSAYLLTVSTSDSIHYNQSVNIFRSLVIASIILLLALFTVDITCCLRRRRGLIAYVCAHSMEQNADKEKEKSIVRSEGCENDHLLKKGTSQKSCTNDMTNVEPSLSTSV